ncbi:MAG: VanW family protein [Clostridiales bacterium]|nr:VanW family protein [Roseburia sp.]MDD7638568.1 VanW family protein [Clostridiales bacterium]MDY4111469.1 VanW family protein [Roseburia sp.]
MKKKQWVFGLIGMLLCAAMVLLQPTEIKAATKAERNAYRAVFDADYYYNTYPDVAATIGNNGEALLNHFVTFGVGEGRSASAAFNPQAYRARYADLQQAFGNDMAAYCRHYVNYGKQEGRNGSADGQAFVATDAQSSTQATQTTGQNVSGNVIASYTTSYEDDVPRVTNVELAARRINGVVVQPGGNFSFSATILPRTAANGYVQAPIYVSGKTGVGTGGGICQVSSTLYAAMVNAGLPATERHAHSLPVDYLPAGLDATIAGNYMDLKFTNTFSQPLLIQAYAEGGTLTVTLVLQ